MKTTEQKIQDAVQSLLKAFQTKEFPNRVAYHIIRRTQEEKDGISKLPCASWSIGNMILMLAADTDIAMGFRQWESWGRHVKKGRHAFYIFAPVLIKGRKETQDVQKDDIKEEQVPRLVGFRAIPVFRYEDTERTSLPFIQRHEPVTSPHFLKVADQLGLSVEYGPLVANYWGYYSRSERVIKLCTHTETVFFHELVHAVDDHLGTISDNTARNEVVAEFGSSVLCQILGIQGYEYRAYSYIKKYVHGKSPRDVLIAVNSVMNDIDRIIRFIIQGGDET